MGKYLFMLFAVSQGCFLLGVLLFIFYHYFPKNKGHIKSSVRWHYVAVASAYILLTAASIRTAILGVYAAGDVWYWFVSASYIVADVSLIILFREAVKNDKKETLNKS